MARISVPDTNGLRFAKIVLHNSASCAPKPVEYSGAPLVAEALLTIRARPKDGLEQPC
jgi:hypothetical protein